MPSYMRTILNAIMAYINYKHKEATDEQIIQLLIETDMIAPVADEAGDYLADENGIILIY